MTNDESDLTALESTKAPEGKPYSILFILTDQERYFRSDESHLDTPYRVANACSVDA
ncbi:hypothetical protein IQ230_24720 [Gloeocapsopsis crepidinum LEGE 06123]|uniref:Sulfatase n=1 Tax=Gloeocapsopsis crepidinum LEGE 06123 TaxID=588587 RepID=A0ABR9UYU1_9CHRO|nr:hypothetical protein [Gloeocapsopsis crepidinum]MBE9193482.1 hypothetical protein [Gloeocapsopsis crepidinum LEGE 06123]